MKDEVLADCQEEEDGDGSEQEDEDKDDYESEEAKFSKTRGFLSLRRCFLPIGKQRKPRGE